MTLLIGTISKKNIVITADGLSRPNPVTGAGIVTDSFQKIFPFNDLPIAIVHHGFNLLAGQPVNQFVTSFQKNANNNLAALTIKEVAEYFLRYSQSAAVKTIADETNQGVIGFWVTGFERSNSTPKLFEICWPDKTEPFRHKGIVIGGDAQNFIKKFLNERLGQFRPSKLKNYSATKAQSYHGALYAQAKVEQDKVRKEIFGGKMHQLVVVKDGWNWIIEPVSS